MACDPTTALIDPKELRELVLATVPTYTSPKRAVHAREPSALRGLFKLALLGVAVREVALWLS